MLIADRSVRMEWGNAALVGSTHFEGRWLKKIRETPRIQFDPRAMYRCYQAAKSVISEPNPEEHVFNVR